MTQLILIAHGRASRRREIADGFGASDAEVEAVADGASALELALARRPALVIAESEVPLVDALKLAEILRANPRTRAVGFVFLGEAADSAARPGLCDVVLAGDASVADIVSHAEEELGVQGRLAALNHDVEGSQRITGYFPDLDFLQVIHWLHLWKRSGRLDLSSEVASGGHGRGSVWLHDGEIVDAELGEAQGRKALYRLMAWERGQFSFDPSGMHVKRSPLAPLAPLLREGTRQRSEWDRLRDQLPELDAPVGLRVRASELPNILHPLTQEVLSLLELHGKVGEVVEQCSYPDYQVLRTLSTLADRRIVELGSAALQRRSDTSLFGEHQIRRLNEWAFSESVHAPDADLKLLVGASCETALADFAGLLRRVPGISLAQDFDLAVAGDSHDRFATLGRLEIEGCVGIEFINVPTCEEMAPLWPMAGSGALGTLFLLSGAVGEAASVVQPMSDALRRLPRSRIFNLFLFHKDEPISPSELGENLSLIDEASLFVLPLEGEKSPLALLRSVFGRVVP